LGQGDEFLVGVVRGCVTLTLTLRTPFNAHRGSVRLVWRG